jgi:hypothetical protein
MTVLVDGRSLKRLFPPPTPRRRMSQFLLRLWAVTWPVTAMTSAENIGSTQSDWHTRSGGCIEQGSLTFAGHLRSERMHIRGLNVDTFVVQNASDPYSLRLFDG